MIRAWFLKKYERLRIGAWRLLALPALLVIALSIQCAVDGPNVIPGREAHARLISAVYSKLIVCDVAISTEFFFALPGFGEISNSSGTFREGAYYDQGDVDRCLNNFNVMPCESFYSADPSDLDGPFLRIVRTPCQGIKENFFPNNPAGQGRIL